MSITIHKSIKEINLSQWEKLIELSSNSSFFQTAECYNFYSQLSFLKPFVYGVSENKELKGVICGYVIADSNIVKRFFSRRAIVPGGILLDDDISDKALQLLLNHLKLELGKKVIYIEIRNFNDYSKFSASYDSEEFRYLSHLNYQISTTDIDQVFQNLSNSKRRQINLSIKAGAIVSEAETDEEIVQFYRLLSDLYRNKVKLPLFAIDFFMKLNLLQNGKVFVVKFRGKVIGGIACVLLQKRIVYEWFVCGDDGFQKNIYPSVLATWAGIEYAVKNGYERFDFMGAGKPNESYGVREFKSKFGGELVEHGRYLFICMPVLYRLGKKVIEILKGKKK